MKKEYKKQIEDFFKEHDKHARITVRFPNHCTCEIDLSVSGRGLGSLVSFKNLSWLSKLFETEDIDIRDEYQSAGCDTCDHGSSTSATIYCKNIKMEPLLIP